MVWISDCIIEYSHAFCHKVFGEILFAPSLEVCTVRALNATLEVEVAGGCRDDCKMASFCTRGDRFRQSREHECAIQSVECSSVFTTALF